MTIQYDKQQKPYLAFSACETGGDTLVSGEIRAYAGIAGLVRRCSCPNTGHTATGMRGWRAGASCEGTPARFADPFLGQGWL